MRAMTTTQLSQGVLYYAIRVLKYKDRDTSGYVRGMAYYYEKAVRRASTADND